MILLKNVSNQKNPPGEFGLIIRSKVQNLTRVFDYLYDSNSNFPPAGMNSELVSARTVCAYVVCVLVCVCKCVRLWVCEVCASVCLSMYAHVKRSMEM